MIGLCFSPRFAEHQTGPHHPERPDRIRAISAALRSAGFLNGINPFPDFHLDLGPMPHAQEPAKVLDFEAADRKWLSLVHTPEHIDYVERVSQLGGGVLDQGDTPIGQNSFEIALLAVGAALRCCDAVMRGEIRRAFAAVRPPGHHAEPDRAMGFCLFSNAAIATRYLQQAHGVKRVAIVDFDVHHGNGTQACFDEDSGVFFASLHQHPRTCYPGSGYDWEIGVGPGRGYTLNLAFNPGAGDVDYLKVIEMRLMPELEEFRPEVMVISAGFDAHHDDPMAQIDLSEAGFEAITRSLVAVAERDCGGRIVSLLEGGYNLRALGRSVVRHLIALE